MEKLDPSVKEAIDIVCDAVALDRLFSEILLMDPEHDKDNIYQCTQELLKKHDLIYVVNFIHAVEDGNVKVAVDNWTSGAGAGLSNKEAKVQLYEMLLALQDFLKSDYKI